MSEAGSNEGTFDGKRIKIAVAFDPFEFERISALAQRNRLSFAAQVRALCKVSVA